MPRRALPRLPTSTIRPTTCEIVHTTWITVPTTLMRLMVFMITLETESATKLRRQAELPIILITVVTVLAIRHQSDKVMLFSAIILSIVLPMQVPTATPRFKPFIVRATIDAAVLAGLPSSRAAKKYAFQSQTPDFLMAEAHLASEPVSWRRLYFRKLFS